MEIQRFVARAACAVALGALVLLAGNAPAAYAAASAAPVVSVADGGEEITVVGTVIAGVEAGCLLLRPDIGIGSDYLLIGGDPKVIFVGAHVKVTGVVGSGNSTCQQGTPLTVTSASPA